MSHNLKTALFGALCGAFLFAATPASSGPLSVAIPQEEGASTTLIQQARYGRYCHWIRYRQCVRWVWRWRHRRCVRWVWVERRICHY